MKNKSLSEEIDKLVNSFIKEWLPDSYAHLIDTDENDGQRLRNSLRSLFKQMAEKIIGPSSIIRSHEELEEIVKINEYNISVIEVWEAEYRSVIHDNVMKSAMRKRLEEILK